MTTQPKPIRIITYYYDGTFAYMWCGRVRRNGTWTPRHYSHTRSFLKIARVLADYIEDHPDCYIENPHGWTITIPGHVIP